MPSSFRFNAFTTLRPTISRKLEHVKVCVQEKEGQKQYDNCSSISRREERRKEEREGGEGRRGEGVEETLSLWQGGECFKACLGGNQSPQSMELSLQFLIGQHSLVSLLQQQSLQCPIDQPLLVLRK